MRSGPSHAGCVRKRLGRSLNFAQLVSNRIISCALLQVNEEMWVSFSKPFLFLFFSLGTTTKTTAEVSTVSEMFSLYTAHLVCITNQFVQFMQRHATTVKPAIRMASNSSSYAAYIVRYKLCFENAAGKCVCN